MTDNNNGKHPGGRPPKYESGEEFSKAINHYFDSITKTEPAFNNVVVGYEDKAKKKPIYEQVPILNNAGEQVSYTHYYEIPSITGLCLHIGITRDTWKAYENREEFIDSIKTAKERVEKYNVEQLYRKDQVTGIIFNLKNNFGWTDKQEIDQNIANKNGDPFKIQDISNMTTEELEKQAREFAKKLVSEG